MTTANAVQSSAVLEPRRWGRVRELRDIFGLTKPWAFGALKDGRIRGKKIGGVLLIDLDSVRELIDHAPDWKR